MTEQEYEALARQEWGGRLPPWLRRPVGAGARFAAVEGVLEELRLETVCVGAGCPNRGECFSCGTATFMILGARCTRNCAFCGVEHVETCAESKEPSPGASHHPLPEREGLRVETDEPGRVAEAAARLGLRHVVVTSVTRDDLADGGAGHFAAVIAAIRGRRPGATVEVLTPDFMGHEEAVATVVEARPDVLNHNLETCRRLTREIRSGADYERSLGVLRAAGRLAREAGSAMRIKSGFMVGLGEEEAEIEEMLQDLRWAGVEMVTIGQYLRPGAWGRGLRGVRRYYRPEEFDPMRRRGEEFGFLHVAAGPFVRSSYFAERSLHEQG